MIQVTLPDWAWWCLFIYLLLSVMAEALKAVAILAKSREVKKIRQEAMSLLENAETPSQQLEAADAINSITARLRAMRERQRPED